MLISSAAEEKGKLVAQLEAAKLLLASEPAAESSHSVYSTPPVQFQEHVFCLSGDFDCFESKSEVEDLILSLGGTASKSVTKKVHYLVVGGAGSADWKFGKYGRKIEKALDYRAKGVAIEVGRPLLHYGLIQLADEPRDLVVPTPHVLFA